MKIITEEMMMLAGIPSKDYGLLAEAKIPSKVRHTYDGGNVATPLDSIARTILGAAGNGVLTHPPRGASVPVDAPNVVELSAFFKSAGYRGRAKVLNISALNPATNKSTVIKSYRIPDKIYFDYTNTKIWWLPGGMNPSYHNPQKVKKAIDDLVKEARSFVSSYMKRAKKAQPSGEGGMLSRAIEINQRLNLRIPKAKLKKLVAELRP